MHEKLRTPLRKPPISLQVFKTLSSWTEYWLTLLEFNNNPKPLALIVKYYRKVTTNTVAILGMSVPLNTKGGLGSISTSASVQKWNVTLHPFKLYSFSSDEMWPQAANLVEQSWRVLERTVEAALRQSRPRIDRAEQRKVLKPERTLKHYEWCLTTKTTNSFGDKWRQILTNRVRKLIHYRAYSLNKLTDRKYKMLYPRRRTLS
jgi:hypothetical protein